MKNHIVYFLIMFFIAYISSIIFTNIFSSDSWITIEKTINLESVDLGARIMGSKVQEVENPSETTLSVIYSCLILSLLFLGLKIYLDKISNRISEDNSTQFNIVGYLLLMGFLSYSMPITFAIGEGWKSIYVNIFTMVIISAISLFFFRKQWKGLLQIQKIIFLAGLVAALASLIVTPIRFYRYDGLISLKLEMIWYVMDLDYKIDPYRFVLMLLIISQISIWSILLLGKRKKAN